MPTVGNVSVSAPLVGREWSFKEIKDSIVSRFRGTRTSNAPSVKIQTNAGSGTAIAKTKAGQRHNISALLRKVASSASTPQAAATRPRASPLSAPAVAPGTPAVDSDATRFKALAKRMDELNDGLTPLVATHEAATTARGTKAQASFLDKRDAMSREVGQLLRDCSDLLEKDLPEADKLKIRDFQRTLVETSLATEMPGFEKAITSDIAAARPESLRTGTRLEGLTAAFRSEAVKSLHAEVSSFVRASAGPEKARGLGLRLESEIAFLKLYGGGGRTLEHLEGLQTALRSVQASPSKPVALASLPAEAVLTREIAGQVGKARRAVEDAEAFVAAYNRGTSPPGTDAGKLAQNLQDQVRWLLGSDIEAMKGKDDATVLKQRQKLDSAVNYVQRLKAAVTDRASYDRGIEALIELAPKLNEAGTSVGSFCRAVLDSSPDHVLTAMSDDYKAGSLALIANVAHDFARGRVMDGIRPDDPKLAAVFSKAREDQCCDLAANKLARAEAKHDATFRTAYQSLLDAAKVDGGRVKQAQIRTIMPSKGDFDDKIRHAREAAAAREDYAALLGIAKRLDDPEVTFLLKASIWTKTKLPEPATRHALGADGSAMTMGEDGRAKPVIGARQLSPTFAEMKAANVRGLSSPDASRLAKGAQANRVLVGPNLDRLANLVRDKPKLGFFLFAFYVHQQKVAQDEADLLGIEEEVAARGNAVVPDDPSKVRATQVDAESIVTLMKMTGVNGESLSGFYKGTTLLPERIREVATKMFGVGFLGPSELEDFQAFTQRSAKAVFENASNQEAVEARVNGSMRRLANALGDKASELAPQMMSGGKPYPPLERVAIGSKAMLDAAKKKLESQLNAGGGLADKLSAYSTARSEFDAAVGTRAAIDEVALGTAAPLRDGAQFSPVRSDRPKGRASADALLEAFKQDAVATDMAKTDAQRSAAAELRDGELGKLRGFDADKMHRPWYRKIGAALSPGAAPTLDSLANTPGKRVALQARAEAVSTLRDPQKARTAQEARTAADTAIAAATEKLQAIWDERQAVDEPAMDTVRQVIRGGVAAVMSGQKQSHGVFEPRTVAAQIDERLRAYGFDGEDLERFRPEIDLACDTFLDGDGVSDWADDIREVDTNTGLVEGRAAEPTLGRRIADEVKSSVSAEGLKKTFLNQAALDGALKEQIADMFVGIEKGESLSLNEGKKISAAATMKFEPTGIAAAKFNAAVARLHNFSVSRTAGGGEEGQGVLKLSIGRGLAGEVGAAIAAEKELSGPAFKLKIGAEVGVDFTGVMRGDRSIEFPADEEGKKHCAEVIAAMVMGDPPPASALEHAASKSVAKGRTHGFGVGGHAEGEVGASIGGLVDGRHAAIAASVDSTSSPVVPGATLAAGAHAGVAASLSKDWATSDRIDHSVETKTTVIEVGFEAAAGVTGTLAAGLGDDLLANTATRHSYVRQDDVSTASQLLGLEAGVEFSARRERVQAAEFKPSSSVEGAKVLQNAETALTSSTAKGLGRALVGIINAPFAERLSKDPGLRDTYAQMAERVRDDDSIEVRYTLRADVVEAYNSRAIAAVKLKNPALQAQAEALLDDLNNYDPNKISIVRTHDEAQDFTGIDVGLRLGIVSGQGSKRTMLEIDLR